MKVVRNDGSADKNDNFIDNPYPTWKKQQEDVGKLGDEARKMNDEVEAVLKSVGTY